MILKEIDTWIMGTALFLGFFTGATIRPFISFEPNPLTKIILWGVLYGVSIILVVIIKLSDRMRFNKNVY